MQTREDGFSRRTLWRRAGTGAVVAGAFIAHSPASMAFAAPANQTDATTLRLNPLEAHRAPFIKTKSPVGQWDGLLPPIGINVTD